MNHPRLHNFNIILILLAREGRWWIFVPFCSRCLWLVGWATAKLGWVCSGGFRGGPSRLRPPLWATDRRSRYCWKRYCIMATVGDAIDSYKQVTATHQSLSLSSNTSCKDDTKSQGWNSASSLPVGVNTKM